MDQETKDKLDAIECRMDKNDRKLEDIEKRVYNTETNVQIINTNLSNMNTMLTEIKDDIKSIKNNRVVDVYEKPMAKDEKLKSQLWGALIGVIISALVAYLR